MSIQRCGLIVWKRFDGHFIARMPYSIATISDQPECQARLDWHCSSLVPLSVAVG